jgi:prephenate dehydrogenase
MAVIGVGQIGGSVALAARAAGAVTEVVGFSRSAETMRAARQLGIIDRAAATAAEAVDGAGVIVLATPVRSLGRIAAQIAPAIAAQALVVDVGSVKVAALRALEPVLPRGVFIACHPLAGTEREGPEAASASLFEGRRCVICPTASTAVDRLEIARRLWTAMGADVVLLDAALHDRVLGAASHLPHIAAYALAAAAGGVDPAILDEMAHLPTTSLRDTTRIAASSPAMWRDIFLDNRTEMLPLIDRLLAEIQALRAAIDAGDDGRLDALLVEAKARRDRVVST